MDSGKSTKGKVFELDVQKYGRFQSKGKSKHQDTNHNDASHKIPFLVSLSIKQFTRSVTKNGGSLIGLFHICLKQSCIHFMCNRTNCTAEPKVAES